MITGMKMSVFKPEKIFLLKASQNFVCTVQSSWGPKLQLTSMVAENCQSKILGFGGVFLLNFGHFFFRFDL